MQRDVQDRQIINGTFGELWVNNEYLATVKSFEAKVNLTYADVNRPRDLWDGKKLLKLDGQGSFVIQKYSSLAIRLMHEKLEKGEIPNIKLMGKLDDPASMGAERVVLKNVTFNNFTLMSFEHAKENEENFDFNFRHYELYDFIEA